MVLFFMKVSIYVSLTRIIIRGLIFHFHWRMVISQPSQVTKQGI